MRGDVKAAALAGAAAVERAMEREIAALQWERAILYATIDAMIISTQKRRAVLHVEIKGPLKTRCKS